MRPVLPRLRAEIDQLKAEYPGAQETELQDGTVHIEIPDVPINAAWEPARLRLLIVVPAGYPSNRPNFFSEPSVRIKASQKPPDGTNTTNIGGKEWRTYCYNPNAWDLSRENLVKYLKFASTRFDEVR